MTGERIAYFVIPTSEVHYRIVVEYVLIIF